MFLDFINLLQGTVKITVESGFPERVLNLCSAHDIAFWDMEWHSPTSFSIKLSRKSFLQLRRLAKKLDCEITVERKSGARGLRSVVEDLLIPIMYDIPSDATITKVTIDADTVENGVPHIEHGMMRPRYKNIALQQQ